MATKQSIRQWLRERGWRLYLKTWWYKPLPGAKGPVMSQELFTTMKAYDIERRQAVVS